MKKLLIFLLMPLLSLGQIRNNSPIYNPTTGTTYIKSLNTPSVNLFAFKDDGTIYIPYLATATVQMLTVGVNGVVSKQAIPSGGGGASITLTTTGNSGAATYNTGTGALNIPNYTLSGLGGIGLTSLSAVSPLSYNNGTGVFSIGVANGSTNGYLSSTDHTLFSGKQAALVSGTNIKTINSTSLLGSGNITTGDALVANPLSQFASTTSAQLAGVLSNETGTGAAVFGTSPTLVTPTLGVATATSINGASIVSGTLNGSVTGTNTGDQTITLTGPVTGSGTSSFATTIIPNAITTTNITDASVTYGKIQNVAARSLFANPGNSATTGVGTPIDSGLVFYGGKLSTKMPKKDVTGTTYTILDSDNGYFLNFTNTSFITVTLPSTGVRDNISLFVYKGPSTGNIRLVATGTLETAGSDTIVQAKSGATVYLKSAGVWVAQGNLGSPVTGGVTSVSSANSDLTVISPTTTPVLTVNSAPKLTTSRTINGTSFDGTGNITVTAVPSGTAGGDLTGTYPNPTVNTINSITKSFYDPTSSIQTQLNSKVSSVSGGTTGLSFIGTTALTMAGTLAAVNGGTGLASLGTSLQQIRVASGGGALEYFTPPNTGIVNNATSNQLAYYSSTGSSVSGLASITGNRALISSATGLPIASTVTNTELGYSSGVTSPIQTQLDTKFVLPALTSGSVLFSNGTTIAQNNSKLFWDNTNNRLGIGTSAPIESIHNVGAFNNDKYSTDDNASTIKLRKARGTGTTAIAANDYISSVEGWGYTSSSGFVRGFYFASMASTVTSTTISADLVIATNSGSSDALERFRITGGGNVRLSSMAGSGTRIVNTDAAGNLGSVALIPDGNISSASTWNAKESALTFSTGLARSTNTITNNLSVGIAGGQVMKFGFNPSDNGTITSTADAIKGKVIIGGSAFDELNTRVGIGTTSPTSLLHVVQTGGNATLLTIQGAAQTGLTASTEAFGFAFLPSFSKNFNTGAISQQREFVVGAPTYSFAASSTITSAATVAIASAPIAGTNATITNSYALWVQSGSSMFNGNILTPSDVAVTDNSKGLVLKSPDGTCWRLSVTNAGAPQFNSITCP